MSDELWSYLVLGGVCACIAAALIMILMAKSRGRSFPGTRHGYLHWGFPHIGKTFALTKRVTLIGRDKSNDLVLTDKTVSRFHAKIVRVWPGRFYILDNNSSNHVYIENKRVERGRIKEGATLGIGSVSLGFSQLSPNTDCEESTVPGAWEHGKHGMSDEEVGITRLDEHEYTERHDRKPVELSVRFHGDRSVWRHGVTRNLGTDGMLIKAKRYSNLDVGHSVEVVFNTQGPGHTRWVHFLGKVASRDEQGLDIIFDQPDPNVEELFKESDRAA